MNLPTTKVLVYMEMHLYAELLRTNLKVFMLDNLSKSKITKKKILKKY